MSYTGVGKCDSCGHSEFDVDMITDRNGILRGSLWVCTLCDEMTFVRTSGGWEDAER